MLIIKLILSSVIIVICSYIGINKGARLDKRVTLLRQVIVFLKYIEVEIKYNLTSIPQIISDSIKNIGEPLGSVLNSIKETIGNGNNLNSKEANTETCINNIDLLLEEDKRIIINLFNNLGNSDIESQMKHIALSSQMLDMQIVSADESRKKLGKMYKTIGVLAGVMIVIVII